MTAATFDQNNEPMIWAMKERLEAEVPDHDINNYFDNNIISGMAGSWLGHLQATSIFLKIECSHGWKFKASKIHITYFQVKLLGVIVSAKGK